MFVRRQKLPKSHKGLPGPGADSTFTVLNVLNGRTVVDALNCGKNEVEIYRDCDLAVGGVLNCFGRKIVLTDCDKYTKEYYRLKYGLEEITPMEMPKDHEEVTVLRAKDRELPPWNGYGTFEDSAQNCVTVELKPPLRDLKNFIKYDRWVDAVRNLSSSFVFFTEDGTYYNVDKHKIVNRCWTRSSYSNLNKF